MSDLVSALRREGKRERDNMRANGIGHPYVVMVETEAAERIEALEAEVAELRKLVERTCGDGCHCMDENNEECALTALDKG